MNFTTRLKHAWDAFRSRDPTKVQTYGIGVGHGRNPDRVRMTIGNERSIIAAIYNRMAIDIASIEIKHVRLDQNGRFVEEIDSELNKALTISPNLDQTPRSFRQDIALSMFDEGNVAIFPSVADMDPVDTGSYKIYELRRGRIKEWYPHHVRVESYDPETGRMADLFLPKEITAIVENPLYTVMNGPNSTLQRLVSKLNILDAIDRQSGSGKMDLIIQLPYSLKSPLKQELAEDRRKKIEMQLTDSKYGIAYIDASERITQLNRPIENNLLQQIEYLTTELYSQLGTTPGVMDGTASEQESLNYNNRIIEPCIAAIADAMKKKFLTKTARSQGQSIMYFRDPFKLVPVSQIAEIADKFTRNEILSSNEIRAIMGFRPSDDPRADELRNANIAASKQDETPTSAPVAKEGSDVE